MKKIATLTFATILLLSSLPVGAQPCAVPCPANMVIKADSNQDGAPFQHSGIRSLEFT